jgi:cytochrome c
MSHKARWIVPLVIAGLQAVATPASASDPAAKQAFTQCSVCHSVVKGGTGVGPSLWGVVGRQPGTLPGFSYSPAMKAKGGKWDDGTLDAFIAHPQKAVPGTRMPFAGQPDPGKRALIIEFLKALK